MSRADSFQLNFVRADNPLEKEIEAKVCRYGKNTHKIEHRKYVTPANRSSPDRIFFTPDTRVFFIEFKRKGAKPTPAQLTEHEFYRRLGFYVFIVDNFEDGKAVMDLMA